MNLIRLSSTIDRLVTGRVTWLVLLLVAVGGCHPAKDYVSLNLQKRYETPFEVWQRVSVVGIGGQKRVEGDDYGHLRITYEGHIVKELSCISNDYMEYFIGGKRYLYAFRSVTNASVGNPRELVVRIDRTGQEVICADVTEYQDPFMRLRLKGIDGHSAVLERLERNEFQEVRVPLSWCPEAAEVVKKKPEGTLPAPPPHGLSPEPGWR